MMMAMSKSEEAEKRHARYLAEKERAVRLAMEWNERNPYQFKLTKHRYGQRNKRVLKQRYLDEVKSKRKEREQGAETDV